jgi:hypothetical protein
VLTPAAILPDAGRVSVSVPPPGFVPPPGGDAPVSVPQPSPPARGRFPRPSRRNLIAAALGVFAAVVALFILFGSSSNLTVDPIAQAATVSSHAPGFRMHMSMSITSSAFNGPIAAYADAVVDPRDHATSMSFTIDFSSVPQAAQALGDSTMSMDMIAAGDDMYLKLPQTLLSAIPSLGDKPWLKMNLAKASGIPGLSTLGDDPTTSNPGQMLQYLGAASDGITNEGQQRVDGIQTSHYHAELGVDRLTADVPSADQAAIQQALSKLRQAIGSTEVPVDVWIDAHHLVRRMAMSMSSHVSGGPSLQETIVADLTNYGPQPRPTLPPADQVQDAGSILSGGHISG